MLDFYISPFPQTSVCHSRLVQMYIKMTQMDNKLQTPSVRNIYMNSMNHKMSILLAKQ